MVELAEAKKRLGVTISSDDELLTQLVADATAYLAKIGVTVEPESGPVTSAIVLIAGTLYRRSDERHGLLNTKVEGIGSRTAFDPASIDEADWQVVRRLTDAYREVSL